MVSVCCMDLSRSARIIGIIGLCISLIMMNVLTTDLLQKVLYERDLEEVLGIGWRDLIPFQNKSQPENKVIPLVLFMYSFINMGSCLLLILASITKQHWFTVPWFICQTFSISCQLIAIIMHYIREPHKYTHHLAIYTFVYVVISIYFWVVVFAAQKEWREQAFKPLLPNIGKEVREPRTSKIYLRNSRLDSPVYYPTTFFSEI